MKEPTEGAGRLRSRALASAEAPIHPSLRVARETRGKEPEHEQDQADDDDRSDNHFLLPTRPVTREGAPEPSERLGKCEREGVVFELFARPDPESTRKPLARYLRGAISQAVGGYASNEARRSAFGVAGSRGEPWSLDMRQAHAAQDGAASQRS